MSIASGRPFRALLALVPLLAWGCDNDDLTPKSGSSSSVPVADAGGGLPFDTTSDDPLDEQSGGSGGGPEGGGPSPAGADQAPVPEPSSLLILGGGLAALAAARKRREQRAQDEGADTSA